MISLVVKFILLAFCLFAGINWFLRPLFPVVALHVPYLTMYMVFGLSGILMACAVLLRK